ncbi:hypothetical protein L6164_025228 [Bauhinia variegata]|uniref:Uncharacterized protein n=1 Tax=Bauhinia variegata TaxID=167791 RepID=A0ACB9M0S7_BAUVA|nr:hypothetical protein L6164_025228 [Bauhinia variegata]
MEVKMIRRGCSWKKLKTLSMFNFVCLEWVDENDLKESTDFDEANSTTIPREVLGDWCNLSFPTYNGL